MGRYMGLDYGSKTVGIAFSDEMKIIASPEETVFRERDGQIRKTLRRITQLAAEKNVETIVVGDPVNMNGTRGERSEKSRAFAEQLRYRLSCEDLDIPVVMWDERLTTVEADGILEESEIDPEKRKTYIDKIAAALILDDWMKMQK